MVGLRISKVSAYFNVIPSNMGSFLLKLYFYGGWISHIERCDSFPQNVVTFSEQNTSQALYRVTQKDAYPYFI